MKSIIGTVCTVQLYMVILVYSYLKIDVLMNRKDLDVLATTLE